MWLFFKPKKPSLQAAARKAVKELRSEFSDEILAKGMSLNDRVNRLRSVELEYINELMGLTDDTADRVFPLFGQFPSASTLEIQGFCASLVASAVHLSELPGDEKPTVIDIYLDLWVDNIVQHAPSLDGKILRGWIDRMWRGFLPGIMRAAADEEAIEMGFPSAPVVLSKELDRLVGVQRNEDDRPLAGKTLKSAVVKAMLRVRSL